MSWLAVLLGLIWVALVIVLWRILADLRALDADSSARGAAGDG